MEISQHLAVAEMLQLSSQADDIIEENGLKISPLTTDNVSSWKHELKNIASSDAYNSLYMIWITYREFWARLTL